MRLELIKFAWKAKILPIKLYSLKYLFKRFNIKVTTSDTLHNNKVYLKHKIFESFYLLNTNLAHKIFY